MKVEVVTAFLGVLSCRRWKPSFFAQTKAEPSDGSEVRSPHLTDSHQSLGRVTHPKSPAQANTLTSKLLGDRLRVGRVHEDVLEDGGGVVAREVVKYRLHEVGGDGEEASPCALVALPGPNRGEVLARWGRLEQHEALFVWVRLADGCRDLLGVVLGDVAPVGEPWQFRGCDLEAVLVNLPRQCKAWLSKALLDEVGACPYSIEGREQHNVTRHGFCPRGRLLIAL